MPQGAGENWQDADAYADGLAAFCRWAVERGFLLENPLKGLRPFDKKPKTKRRALTPHDIQKLLFGVGTDKPFVTLGETNG